jgi:hypothetical protein
MLPVPAQGGRHMRDPDRSARDGSGNGDAGVYGLRVIGMMGMDLQEASDEGQTVRLRVEVRTLPVNGVHFDERTLRLPMGPGADAIVDRDAGEAVLLSTRRVPRAELAHPFLSVPGIAFAYWRGADPLHGGAFVIGGGAVVVLGGKNAGKTTTLAGLAELGGAVLADDLAVVEQGQVLPGPRALDLRPSAARAAGLWERTRWVRGRRRLSLPPSLGRLPLRAVVVLAWGPRVCLQPLRTSERLQTASRYRFLAGLGPGAGPVQMDLLAAPWWRLERPRQANALPATLDRLQEEFG